MSTSGVDHPDARAPEGEQVRRMFDRIAPVYDPLNSLMTAGLHRQWRRRTAALTIRTPGDRVLDIAAGTGDLTIELARGLGPDGEVVGCDFSERMLTRARNKAPNLRFETADALALPYPDDSFDAATVGFGARNFSDLDAGIREMARVVRAGGRVVILDFTTPQRPPMSWFFGLWFDRVVPLLGRLAGNSQAYSYLPDSVKRFPNPERIAAIMNQNGLRDVRYILTAGGIVTLHMGTVR
jgi:demethylmenaquinone methyltransferase/2-methoxy-6-polyprenyl-1,4-benzoquinol methylase